MPITVKCVCGKQYRLGDQFAGKRAKCPACGDTISVPCQKEEVLTLLERQSDDPKVENTGSVSKPIFSLPNSCAIRFGLAGIIVLFLIVGGILVGQKISSNTTRNQSPHSNPPATSPKQDETVYGRVSGAAWTVKNDGSSNVLRGIPIFIAEKNTSDIQGLIDNLNNQKEGWQKVADYDNRERKTSDEEIAKSQVRSIQKSIDSFSGKNSIDRLFAFELEKKAVHSQKKDSRGENWQNEVRTRPAVLTGLGPSGIDFGAGKTNVDGKFVFEKVPPGDYYLISAFISETLCVEWIVPFRVDGNKETSVDLDNSNVVYVGQSEINGVWWP